MSAIPAFSVSQLEAIAQALDEPTGAQIGALLARVGIEDSDVSTKWRRLFDAFSKQQARDHCANAVCAYAQASMDPVRYAGRADTFALLREKLNVPLAFAGLSLGVDGTLREIDQARTLDEAENRARRLRSELVRRGIHPDVLRFCRAELLQENYFHAVFEATKSVAEKLRQLSGLTFDGAELVDHALGLGASGIPVLAFNSLRSETEQNEHRGLMNLLKGMFGTFRNTTAHAPKIHWIVTELDALDLFSLCSLLHRRLDIAVRTQVEA